MQLPNIRLAPVSNLALHETTDPARVQRLAAVTMFSQAFKVLRTSIGGHRVDATLTTLAQADRTAEVH